MAPPDLLVVALCELEERDQLLLVRHDVRASVEQHVVRVQDPLADPDLRVDLELLLDLLEGVPARRARGDRAERAAAAAPAADLDETVHAREPYGRDLLDLRGLLRAEHDVRREELIAERLSDDLLDEQVRFALDDAVDAAEAVHELLDPGKLDPGRGRELPGARTPRDDLEAPLAGLDHGRLCEHPLEVDAVEGLLFHHAREGGARRVEPEVVVPRDQEDLRLARHVLVEVAWVNDPSVESGVHEGRLDLPHPVGGLAGVAVLV